MGRSVTGEDQIRVVMKSSRIFARVGPTHGGSSTSLLARFDKPKPGPECSQFDSVLTLESRGGGIA